MRLTGGRLIVPKPSDSSATMPSQEPDRSAEAVRRVLPELASWIDTSAALLRGETERFAISMVDVQNEPNFS